MDHYDVIVIGSGLGGLLSAVMLSKEGLRVCVLEKDKQIGGCLQTFSLHKTVLDSCVHYIGGLAEGNTLHKIFKHAGIMDHLKLKPFDENGFDRMIFGNESASYPQAVGFDNFVKQLLHYFPKEKEALENYVQLIKKAGDHFPLYRLRNGDASEKMKVANWSLTETLKKITPDKRLQNVLAGNNLLYAGEAGKSPFYLHALVIESYIQSAHKIVPGSSQIAKFLCKELRKHGGEIYRNTEITKLVEEKGLLAYAESSNGQRFYGNQFIANIHPKILLEKLETKLIRSAYRNRIKNLQQTRSSFMLNLVLRERTIPMRNYNLYWNATNDVWDAVNYSKESWPQNYALYFTESKNHKGFVESVSILTYMHFEEVAQWENTKNLSGDEQERGDDYENFKQVHAEKLLKRVYLQLPNLKGNILAQSAATPLTYRDYTASPKGSLYGILKDVNKTAETTISTRTKIPNLLLTGQNVNLHGVLGVSITAIATCSELIGMDYLLNKINKQ